MKYEVILILSVIFIAGCTNYGNTKSASDNSYGSTVKTPETEYSNVQEHNEYPVKPLTEDTQTPYENIEEIPIENYQTLSKNRNGPEIPSEYEKSQLPDCEGKTFTNYPIDLSKAYEVVPLGNLAPPGHTFPTEHSYTHISAGGTTTETIPLYSPADVKLLLIAFGHGMTQDPVDYTLYFALCKDVIGYYNHVKEISPELQNLMENKQCKFQGESKATRCNIEVFESIKSGSAIGKVGRLQGNYDFGLIDLRTTNVFANPSRYGTRSLHIQCPYDYYDISMKEKFFGLITRKDADRCGKVAQDIPGTLKGNWFYGNARADMGTDWDKYLAFVQDNKDPTISVISIGGVFTEASKIEFQPTTTGFVNREFSQVTPDGNIYCYESGNDAYSTSKVIVQMTSAAEIKIEKQSGSCGSSNSFTSSYKTYNR